MQAIRIQSDFISSLHWLDCFVWQLKLSAGLQDSSKFNTTEELLWQKLLNKIR